MAVYGFPTSQNDKNYLIMKNMADTNPNLETLYDNDSTIIIIRHIGLNCFIRFEWTYYGLQTYTGTAWTSGESLVNQIRIGLAGSYEGIRSNIAVTTDHLVVHVQNTEGAYSYVLVIGRCSDGQVVCLGLRGSSDYYRPIHWSSTQPHSILPAFPMIRSGFNLDGNFLKAPVYIANSAGALFKNPDGTPVRMETVEVLCKVATYSEMFLVLGQDVLVCAGWDSTGDIPGRPTLIIPGAAS